MSSPWEAVIQPEFLEDLTHWARHDPRTARRLLELMRAILRDPFTGIGKPEPLKHLGAGVWSRRILAARHKCETRCDRTGLS
jgi:toxin YoeB